MRHHRQLYLILFIILLNCAYPPSHVSETILLTEIDFRAFTSEGFLFTPGEYNGDYEAIGVVSIDYYPEANIVESDRNATGKEWEQALPDHQRALVRVQEICLQMGQMP